MRLSVLCLLCVILAPFRANAGDLPRYEKVEDYGPPAPKREFRGLWVATVHNIDWPSTFSLSAEEQQAEMIAILDRMKRLRMNALVLQVRCECDALYESKLEPWSPWLTGEMGKSPGYDPLRFTLREAHRRGIEVHAWINPFRAKNSQHGRFSEDHISFTDPELVRAYGNRGWLEPTNPKVRERILTVVRDIITRYPVDAIHMDDYFYPYPEKDGRGDYRTFDDAPSRQLYEESGGELSIGDWRRDHVSQFVQEMQETIQETTPWVKFGISPFGVWRPGYPESVKNSLDAYETLYADVRLWWHEGWMDYLAPQLYWSSYHPQLGFEGLHDWWRDENLQQRHLWPGIATYRILSDIEPKRMALEPIGQIQVTRRNASEFASPGHIHYSAKAIMENRGGIVPLLKASTYAEPALTPEYPWRSQEMPAARLDVRGTTEEAVILSWELEDHPLKVRWWLLRGSTDGHEWDLHELLPAPIRNVALEAFPKKIAITPVGYAGELGESSTVVLREPE